ncbi:MAG: NAD(P)/FAD-dependent oxidoreductase [Deltaproteobacteria bacterium]|nr:NAD(P)/FAD-dependent oxidoreductase [Deltaproteobacteria bacterium]
MHDCDAIIIGSGSGGLVAALALAQAGHRVRVLEQHHLPGGYSQSFTVEGFSFSPGIHYIGQLGPGGGLRKIYEGLGIANELDFLELDPDGYDRVFVGDERFDIPKGREHFAERLKQRFPSEAKGIDGYFDTVHRMSEELVWAHPPQGAREAALLPIRLRTVLRYGLMPLNRMLDHFTHEPLLRAILSIQSGDHGMAPSRAPAALHAGLQEYYFDGGCYPRGGAHAIPEALIGQIERHGGTIQLGAEVDRILIEDGAAIGARLTDGQELRADVVISNADPGVTWGKLVEPQHQSARLRRRIERMRYSVSTAGLFMAVDMDLRAAGLDSGNVWYSRTPDVDAAYRLADSDDLSNIHDVPGMFFNATTLKDPSLRSDGLHTVEAMALATSRPFAKWRNSKHGARPDDYYRLKEHLAQRILAEIDRFLPGFSDRVVFRTLGTPLTNMHFLHASEGGIYGTEKTLRNLGPFSFPVRSPIRGLFQCGASTIAPGINGVSKSGMAAAAAVLDCQPDDLLTATGQNVRIYPAEDPAAWPEAIRPTMGPRA